MVPVMSRRRARAFSVIELLVVIGIIGILLALLLPTLSSARRQSRALACKAQLQNIGAAFQMYLNENDGWYPPAPYSPTFNPQKLTLVSDFLGRYLEDENKRIWRCPGDETIFPQHGLSYSYYQELGDRRITQTFFFKILRSSSLVPILWDAEGTFHGGAVPFNWLFADGHVDNFLKDVPFNPNDPPRRKLTMEKLEEHQQQQD
jgi:prepilin-type N-terminal cleavage/methylation domain-containing protein/prepilin-type processing-associated H-X9-DG protein